MCILAQGIESIRVKELTESIELLVFVDAQRRCVRREFYDCVEVFTSTQLSLSLMIQERVELAPDTPVHDMFRVLVIRTHDGSLSPYLDGVSVLSLRKHCPGARMALEQDEVSKRYLPTRADTKK